MRDLFEGIEELDELFSSSEVEGGEGEPEAAEPAPEPAQPIGFVTRELEGPDGSIIEVEVPVYAASEASDEQPEEPIREGDGPDDDEPQHEDLADLIAAEDADEEPL